MKALTVKQPFAHLIAMDVKPLEIRSWTTKYRGDLLITSSKTMAAGIEWTGEELTLGTTQCVVTLVDIRPFVKRDAKKAWCDYFPDQFAWVLDLQYRTAPVPVKGAVGLWTPDPRLIKSLQPIEPIIVRPGR